jgi:hypothetical protein
MDDQWNEKLCCPRCNNTGMAGLSQPEGTYVPLVDNLPDGFKVVKTEYGINFECRDCAVAVAA